MLSNEGIKARLGGALMCWPQARRRRLGTAAPKHMWSHRVPACALACLHVSLCRAEARSSVDKPNGLVFALPYGHGEEEENVKADLGSNQSHGSFDGFRCHYNRGLCTAASSSTGLTLTLPVATDGCEVAQRCPVSISDTPI